MVLSLQQLRTPVTEEQVLQDLLTRLTELGFSATSWEDGDPARTLLQAFARKYSKATEWVQVLALGLFNETATGDFLTALSRSVFANERIPAVATQHQIRHTLAAGEGPHTIAIGQLVATDGSQTFRNIAGGTLSAGTTPLTLLYEAEVAGAAGNAAANTITVLQTTLSGVTITNPDASPFVRGADAEADAKLRLRNSTKWGTLAIDMPESGYRNVALSIAGVGRAAVDDQNPDGPGTVDVYIAGVDGPPGAGLAAQVQALIDTRRSVTAIVTALDAASQNLDVAGVVYYLSGYPAAPAAVDAAVAAYVNTLPIEGIALDGSTRGVPRDAIEAVIRSIPGVQNVNLTSPSADVVVAPFKIAVAVLTGLTKTPI